MNRLKERRLELGLTQEAVSGVLKLVDPRIDTCMVSRFENGVCLPTEEVMTALEAALRTSRAYLYGDEDKADIPQRTAETERIAALIPYGRRNAISRAELAAAMQTSDRMMRKAVSEAKRQGVMICNDGEGYYQTKELGDLYRQYRRDTARAMSILKARKPMRDVLKAAVDRYEKRDAVLGTGAALRAEGLRSARLPRVRGGDGHLLQEQGRRHRGVRLLH